MVGNDDRERRDLPAREQPLEGHISHGAHHLPLRVYYEDTDAGGVVYHASYLRFFERARWEMTALCGADLRTAAQDGTGFYVVAEAHLKYLAPAALGDALVIVSAVEMLGSSTCVVQQKVMRDRLLLVEGRIRLAFVGPNGKPKRQPEAWLEAFRAVMEAKGA